MTKLEMMAPESLPNISFFTPDVQATFGNFLKSVLFVAMPLLLIWLATEYGALLITVIRDAFSRITSSRDGDDEDEDTRD